MSYVLVYENVPKTEKMLWFFTGANNILTVTPVLLGRIFRVHSIPSVQEFEKISPLCRKIIADAIAAEQAFVLCSAAAAEQSAKEVKRQEPARLAEVKAEGKAKVDEALRLAFTAKELQEYEQAQAQKHAQEKGLSDEKAAVSAARDAKRLAQATEYRLLERRVSELGLLIAAVIKYNPRCERSKAKGKKLRFSGPHAYRTEAWLMTDDFLAGHIAAIAKDWLPVIRGVSNAPLQITKPDQRTLPSEEIARELRARAVVLEDFDSRVLLAKRDWSDTVPIMPGTDKRGWAILTEHMHKALELPYSGRFLAARAVSVVLYGNPYGLTVPLSGPEVSSTDGYAVTLLDVVILFRRLIPLIQYKIAKHDEAQSVRLTLTGEKP